MFESYIEKIGRIISAQYGLKVIFKGNQACTDGKTIYLPYIDKLTPELKEDFEGYIDHEVSHCLFTDFAVNDRIKDDGLLKVVVNLAEDIRIEDRMYDRYPGTKNSIRPLRNKLAAKTEENWAKMPLLNKILANLQFGIENRPELQDKLAEKYLKKLRKYVPEFSRAGNTSDVVDVAEKVSTLLRKLHKEQMEEMADQHGKEAGEAMEKGDAQGAESFGKTKEEKEALKRLAEMTKDMQGSAPEQDTITEMINEAIEEHLESQMKIDPTWSNIKESIPLTTEYDKVTDLSGKGNYGEYTNCKAEVAPYINPIRRKLERVLKVREDAKWKLERERGRLNTRSLAKLISEPGYSKPFKERVRTETKNVAVQLLIDMSGSMSGSKIHTAKLAAIAMSEALRDLDVEFEVSGFQTVDCPQMSRSSISGKLGKRFNRTDRALDNKVFKSFDSHSLVALEQIEAGMDNADSEAVLWAGKRLSARNKKRKIFIIFSDGSPSSGSSDRGILCSHLKKVVKDLSNHGIEMVGVGIQSEHVKEFYPEHILVDNIQDLPVKLMGKLTQILLR